MIDPATAPRRLRAQDVIDAQQAALLAALTRSGEPYVTVAPTSTPTSKGGHGEHLRV